MQNIFLSDEIEFLKPEFQSGSSEKPFPIHLKGIQRKYTILDKKKSNKMEDSEEMIEQTRESLEGLRKYVAANVHPDRLK